MAIAAPFHQRRWSRAFLFAASVISTSPFPLPRNSFISSSSTIKPVGLSHKFHSHWSKNAKPGVVVEDEPIPNGSNGSNENSDQSPNGSSDGKRQKISKRVKEKNLYEVLGATQAMTKQEIKRLYITLAKETHPDSAGSSPETVQRFNDVARAWSTLSDPKLRRKYDRELAADVLKEEIVEYVADAAREYGPTARKFYDEFAIPLLRRTAATTLAGFAAVTEEVAGKESGDLVVSSPNGVKDSESRGSGTEKKEKKTSFADFGRAFQRVIEAGQNATKKIDGLELQNKSLELRKRADEARAESLETLERLAEVKSERLRLTFHTSSANFTSVEALQFLDGFNTLDEVTLVDRMTFKHTIRHDIEAFTDAESDFEKILQEKNDVDQQAGERERELRNAERAVNAATMAEAQARKMLEEAEKQVAQSQTRLSEAQRAVSNIGVVVKRTNQELEKSNNQLKRKRDVVRKALRRKEESSKETNRQGNSRDQSSMDAMGFEKQKIVKIEALKQDENRIEAEFLSLVEKASRLVSRSERLKFRSEELIGEQSVKDSEPKNPIEDDRPETLTEGKNGSSHVEEELSNKETAKNASDSRIATEKIGDPTYNNQ